MINALAVLYTLQYRVLVWQRQYGDLRHPGFWGQFSWKTRRPDSRFQLQVRLTLNYVILV